MNFKLTQGHRQSCHSIAIGYMISYLSSIVTIVTVQVGDIYVSNLHRFWDIIAYFRKFKDVTWPWPRPFKGHLSVTDTQTDKHMTMAYTTSRGNKLCQLCTHVGLLEAVAFTSLLYCNLKTKMSYTLYTYLSVVYMLFLVAQFMEFDLDNSGDIGMIRRMKHVC